MDIITSKQAIGIMEANGYIIQDVLPPNIAVSPELRDRIVECLNELEWSDTYSYCTGWKSCPSCHGIKTGYGADEYGNLPINSGHRDTCEINNILAELKDSVKE